MSEKNSFLDTIKALTKQEISDQQISHDLLWLIQHELETKGPFHINQLNQLLDKYSKELSESMACNLKSKNWKPFFEHSQFQKRKKEPRKPIIKSEEKDRNNFHVLINGQKKGPYSASKLLALLDSKELTMNNLLSADDGRSWRKIYHFPQFDRRKNVDIDISVQTPDEDHFEKSRVYTTELLKKLNLKKNQESLEDALLACQTHLHKKKDKRASTENIGDKLSHEYLSSTKKGFGTSLFKINFDKKGAPKILVAGLAVIVLMLFLFDDKSKKPRKNKQGNQTTEAKVEQRRREPRRPSSTRRERSSYSSRNREERRSRVDNSELEIDHSAAPSPRKTYSNDDRDRYEEDPPLEDDYRQRRRPRRRAREDDRYSNDIDDRREEEYPDDRDRLPAYNDRNEFDDDLIDVEGENIMPEGIDENFINDNEFDEGFDGEI